MGPQTPSPITYLTKFFSSYFFVYFFIGNPTTGGPRYRFAVEKPQLGYKRLRVEEMAQQLRDPGPVEAGTSKCNSSKGTQCPPLVFVSICIRVPMTPPPHTHTI